MCVIIKKYPKTEHQLNQGKNIKITVLKLGIECRDLATESIGTLTHQMIDTGRNINYIFQPKGLNPENGQPIKKIILEKERIHPKDQIYEQIDVPFEILRSQVEDKASGFKGMAVRFVRHRNGCFHVVIQPKGRLEKTGEPISSSDFDIRGCVGEKIPILTETEKKKSEADTPSPIGGIPDDYRPNGT